MKNIITRALGTKEDVEVDITVRDVYPGDSILLCSDGLSGMVDEKDILQTVLSRKEDLDKATESSSGARTRMAATTTSRSF
jgi:protein phosphatase